VDDSLPPRTVVLEALNIMECVAPASLDVERYLPPSPLSVAVDTRLQVRPEFSPGERSRLRAGDRVFDLSAQRKVLAALVPPMLERIRLATVELAQARIDAAVAKADMLLSNEIDRLTALARVNPSVRPAEIAALEKERDDLLAVLPTARPRLDSLRLVASTDFLQLRR
jgi:ATP-dependent helicase HepA